MKHSQILAIALLMVVLVSCNNTTGPTDPLKIPDVYASTSWQTNAAVELQQLSDVGELVDALEAGRAQGVVIDRAAVAAELAKLAPFLSAASFSEVSNYINLAIESSGNMYDAMQAHTMSTKGGVYGRYLFNKNGLDATELVEKYLFGSLMYMQATTALNATTISPNNVDKALACFGATPEFKNTDKALTNHDRFCAAYAARRDKADGQGMYTQLKKKFITALTAAKAGANYNDDYYSAIADIRQLWERSQMASCIHYCYATISGLSATNISDSSRSSAMHAFGEAAGFVVGWKSVPATMRIISDADLNEVLGLLQMPVGGVSNCQNVWQLPVTVLPQIEFATKKLQTVYGFSDAEMLDFRQNWVNVQGRQ
ncbi:MAG: hypothetical protein HQ472_04450 [Ignavibacteria bacterium]|nr:hypothetical protein [Ignavibacteria bacterium]